MTKETEKAVNDIVNFECSPIFTFALKRAHERGCLHISQISDTKEYQDAIIVIETEIRKINTEDIYGNTPFNYNQAILS